MFYSKLSYGKIEQIQKIFSRKTLLFGKHFHEKSWQLQLKKSKLLFQSKMNSKRFGSYYFGFHASHLSNQLQDHIKNETSVKAINDKLVENWQEVILSFSEWNQADKINQKIALKKDGAI